MIPVTLQLKSEKFLKSFTKTLISNKELHLLIDLIKLEEYPSTISNNKTIFGYFIIHEKDRDQFFRDFHTFKQYYEKDKRITKLSKSLIYSRIKSLGFHIELSRVINFYYPTKLSTKLDRRFNKKDKRYYDSRSRSSLNEGTRT
jgi:hypothetical protein